MTTAIIFAGADALDALEHRTAAAQSQKINLRLAEASVIWQRLTGDMQSLNDFLVADDKTFHGNFTKKAICCTAVQVALYDYAISLGVLPDFLIGCSLGDSARTVCSGASSFEEAVLGISLFGLRGESIQGGAILQLKFLQPPSPEEIFSLEKRGLSLAVYQTPNRVLVAGAENEIQALHEECKNNDNLKARYLYNKPLHSPWMEPAADSVKLRALMSHTTAWKIPMISTTLKRLIESPQDLYQDLVQNMTGTVYWYQSIQEAVSQFQIQTLLNIGPSKTLLAFLEQTPLSTPVNLVDFPIRDVA